MEPLDITYSIGKNKFTSTFKDVDISLLNAIRVQLLNTSTCWAFAYTIIDSFNVSSVDEETFIDMIGDIPINDQSIFKIDIRNDSEERIFVTSNDLSPVIKLKIPPDTNIDIDSNGTFKCLAYINKNSDMNINVLTNNTRLTNISLSKVIREAISPYVINSSPNSGLIIQRTYDRGKISFHTSKKSHRIIPNIKLVELSKGDHISMIFVSDKGSPSDDPKWSAVSLASAYKSSSTEVNLDFQVKSILYKPRDILKEAIDKQIKDLTNIRNFFDNDEEEE